MGFTGFDYYITYAYMMLHIAVGAQVLKEGGRKVRKEGRMKMGWTFISGT